MEIPAYHSFYRFILDFLKDEKEHSRKDIVNGVAFAAGLTEADRNETYDISGVVKYRDRIG